ncbi:MAG TPA: helix-turn-helix domain-containing protein [Patescibacteria group bacterium]|nr:helix-turn-helix domain-containing protein [Patescibacteria group bacterium]
MVERPTALRLGILVFDGVMMSSIAAPSDALRVADKLAQLRFGASAPGFRTELVHARGAGSVMTSSGMTLSGIVAPERDPDVLLIPGVMHGSAGELLQTTAALTAEIELIRAMHLRGVRVAGSCTGTFLLAMSGLLDGRPATTSWWLAAAFRQAFPLVDLQADELVVESGDVATAGGASAVLDFVLRQIARVTDAALAQQTAKLLLVDPERQSQAPYVSAALIEKPRSTLTEKIEKFLSHEMHRALSVAEIAAHVGASERTLLRHCRSQFGAGPLAHLQRLRVERAKALLETSRLSFDEIVERCGYSDSASFRKLFKRETHLTPADYRERFTLRAH